MIMEIQNMTMKKTRLLKLVNFAFVAKRINALSDIFFFYF